MYALVFAPHGIVGEDGSWVKLFDSYEDAHNRMRSCVYSYEERDFLSDVELGERHATTFVADPQGPEWHIYDVLSPAMRSLDEAITLG